MPTTSYGEKVAEARALLKANNAKAALAASQAAIALDDKRWEAYVAAANAYASQGLYDDAVGMLQAALARAPEERKSPIREALAETRRALSSAPLQRPETETAASVSAPTQAEIVLWKTVEGSENLEDLATFLRLYPNSVFAPLVKNRMAKLGGSGRNFDQLLEAFNKKLKEMGPARFRQVESDNLGVSTREAIYSIENFRGSCENGLETAFQVRDSEDKRARDPRFSSTYRSKGSRSFHLDIASPEFQVSADEDKPPDYDESGWQVFMGPGREYNRTREYGMTDEPPRVERRRDSDGGTLMMVRNATDAKELIALLQKLHQSCVVVR